jgi:REP element-mobilizing transposase RayT
LLFSLLGRRYVVEMARLRRTELPDGCFHVTAVGPGETHVFEEDLDRLEFLHALGIALERFEWRLFVYCLMGTHYHLMVESKITKLIEGMQWLNSVYAQGFNKRYGRRGHLFGSRFGAKLIRDQQHFDATVTYVLNNPVRAGLCDRAEDWPWSYAAAEVGGLAAAA